MRTGWPIVYTSGDSVFQIAAHEDVIPIAFQGDLPGAHSVMDALTCKVGEGITGHVAHTGQSLLAPDAATSRHARRITGTPAIDESLLAVPLNYGTRTVGVIVMVLLLGMEIRNYRQRKTLAGIERVS